MSASIRLPEPAPESAVTPVGTVRPRAGSPSPIEPLVRMGARLLQVPVVAVYGVEGRAAELLGAVGPADVLAGLRAQEDAARLARTEPLGYRVGSQADPGDSLPIATGAFAPSTVLAAPAWSITGDLAAVAYFLDDRARPDLEGPEPPPVLHDWLRTLSALLPPHEGSGRFQAPIPAAPPLPAPPLPAQPLPAQPERSDDPVYPGSVAVPHGSPELDELTGLPNRALAERRLDRDLVEAARRRVGVSVAMIALDRFKRVNDSLGHARGDALLRQVAERLATCVSEGDTVARLGGDEFLVILNRIGGHRQPLPLADRLLQAVQEPFHVDGHELVISASMGLATFPDDAKDGPALRQFADIALHRAKEQGRGRLQCFEAQMRNSAEDRLRIERELRRALEERQFVLYYQTKHALADGRITGSESLIRWIHPHKGLVFPGHFIGVAEETGLIVPIGTWSLVEACRQRRIWRDLGLELGTVSVNVAAPQFARRDFVGSVERALRTSGLEPDGLELEVTESMIMDDVQNAAERLAALRHLGVKVSVDDFGTGYSSLAYLQRLPVDVLKIDRTFVKDLDAGGSTGEQARVLAHAITTLGHSLGLRVIAEGVETIEQLEVLQGFGCDEAQGFLFAHPVPPEQIEDDEPKVLSGAKRRSPKETAPA